MRQMIEVHQSNNMRAHTRYTMYYSMIAWALLARKNCFVRHTDLHTHSTVPEPEPEQHLPMFVAYREHNTSHRVAHAYHACGLKCFVYLKIRRVSIDEKSCLNRLRGARLTHRGLGTVYRA